MTSPADQLPVAVIGGGPVGLAAAAHLADRGVPFVVLEAGAEVAAAVREWRHVRLFSPWRYVVDPIAQRLLEAAGWQAPDGDAYPTGGDLVADYLAPLAALPAIASGLRLGHRVRHVTRRGADKLRSHRREDRPFELVVDTADGTQRHLARAVIDASGTWTQPNPLGAGGIPAPGEEALAERIDRHIPDVLGADRDRFAGRRIAVFGSGHSAFNVLLDLVTLREEEPGTSLVWAIRRTQLGQLFGGGEDDQLVERGRLGQRIERLVRDGAVELVTGFATDHLDTTDDGRVRVVGTALDGPAPVVEADHVVAAVGFRPDRAMTAELRLDVDPLVETTRALAPLIDPNLHSCGTVPPHGVRELAHPEPGYVAVGMRSYGRAPSFLLLTGYEQVRSVVADLVGDREAAERVELVLPETGVCRSDPLDDGDGAGCCAPAPQLIQLGG